MFATFVATNSWQKADWLAATGPSTTQLSLLTLSVTKYSETKSTWQSTLAKYACGSCGCQTNRKFSFGRHGQESVIHLSVLLLVLWVRKRLWTNGIWRDTQRKTMDSLRKETLLRTVQGLWKRNWVKREQNGFFTNVKGVSTVLSKKQILGDTYKVSMTEGQNQICEEGKLRLALSLTEPRRRNSERSPQHPLHHCTMRLSPLQSVNRTIYQNVYLAIHFFSAPLFQMTNIWRKYLITFIFIVYLTTWVMNNHSHNQIQ